MLSYEFCEISKNTFSYRTPPAAASGWEQFAPIWQITGLVEIDYWCSFTFCLILTIPKY